MRAGAQELVHSEKCRVFAHQIRKLKRLVMDQFTEFVDVLLRRWLGVLLTIPVEGCADGGGKVDALGKSLEKAHYGDYSRALLSNKIGRYELWERWGLGEMVPSLY